ncbi:hypothetical protein D3C71_1649960 [compost metagenome]
MPGAEIIHDDAHPMYPQSSEGGENVFAIVQKGRLGDLQLQPARLQPRSPQDTKDLIEKIGKQELHRRDIDRNR